METSLATLHATLTSIKGLHERQKRKRAYQPFTAAILNSHNLQVEDYIRDADQLENNLFWYPPLSRSTGTEEKLNPSSKAKDDPQLDDVASVAPRLPEPKEFVPPTPLKKQAKDAEARGLVTFDARTLLKAAQSLLENYHNAPRARKHIKTLLKKHAELHKTITQYESFIAESEPMISKLSNPFESQGFISSLQAQAKAQSEVSRSTKEDRVTSEEVKNLEEAARKEEMEIFALEQQREELVEKRARLASKKTAASKASRSVAAPSEASSSKTPVSGTEISGRRSTVMPKPDASRSRLIGEPNHAEDLEAEEGDVTITLTKNDGRAAKLSTEDVSKLDVTPRGLQGDETIHLEASGPVGEESTTNLLGDEDEGDAPSLGQNASLSLQQSIDAQAVLDAAEEVPDDEEDVSAVFTGQPESTDELERISENVWTAFGDNLRYAAPDRESADFPETLALLDEIAMCKGEGSNNAGDLSITSSQTGSQITQATSGSVAGGGSNLPNAGPPTPTSVVAAYILGSLLRSPEPHAKDFGEVKADSDAWWAEIGIHAFRKGGTGAGSEEQSEKGEQLATKAVYGLVAKKLLRIKHGGNTRLLSFA